MSRTKKWLCGIAMILMNSAAQSAEFTNALPVGSIIMDGANYQIAAGPLGTAWGAASCSTVPYLLIPYTSTNAKEMFALLLAAKTSGLTVLAYGSCSGGYFVPTWVEVY